ncbi:aminotransferase class III-fold pyridoxal phosphate-dependent enzyme [Xenorhabdus siamensis]|uniref:aminotransferase class III-fold pyridoxal phosphate-dependent enzyme n=1 Tax=Xenorhabdus siamensis TaxID=3136254 RepID=UPI0030F3A451
MCSNEVGIDNIKVKGEYLGNLLFDVLKKFSFVVDIRGKGLMWAIETTFNQDYSINFIKSGHKYGINIYSCISSGKNGDALTLLLTPPLTITKPELEELVTRVKMVFEDYI